MKHRYEDIEVAQNYLATCLKEGTLSLALGAGVSASMGLPSWVQLVNSCCKAVGIKKRYRKTQSNEVLLRAMNNVEDTVKKKATQENKNFSAEYHNLVRKSLYRKIKPSHMIAQQPLLIAIGALISGSTRGSVKEVITLNYDDILEWYLEVYGLSSQVVSKLPVLKKNCDVLIHHLHGYVPFDNSKDSSLSFILLSKRSYDKYLASERLNLQQIALKDLLTSKVVLFIGLSGDDATFGPIFTDVKNRTKKNNPHRGPLGVWLMGSDPDSGKTKEIREWGCAPVTLSHEKYPSFIFGICQKALKLQI